MIQVGMYKIFPRLIMNYTDVITNDLNDKIIEYALDDEKKYKDNGNKWFGEMYSTGSHYNIVNDNRFLEFNKSVSDCITHYVSQFNSDYKYNMQEGWINIGRQNSFQEFHAHQYCTISCCYYANVPDGSGKIVFTDPYDDLMPIRGIKDYNELCYDHYSFLPEPRSLLVWRSYMRHMVQQGNNTEPRISIACNF